MRIKDLDSEADSPRNQRDGASLRCASDVTDVFAYCGLDTEKLKMGKRCEKRFKELFKTYTERVSHYDGECTCSPEDFLDDAMETMRVEKIHWPPALLARKKQIEELAAP